MDSESIVISGISGRFPESKNVDEFWSNLLNGVDLITEDNRRWPKGFHNTPERKGTLANNLESFDAEFFNINKKQVERLDPQIRQLLEVTFEAIIDSGQNPTSLRGNAVGVFVGASSYETYDASRISNETVTGYDIVGSSGCTFANRISYHFDFKGPSLSVDTFCSSSSMALHLAFSQIRAGNIDIAVVGGINLLLDPLVSLQMQQLGTLSSFGKCRSFDASGSGYVRSEAIVSILIMKKTLAHKYYAEIVHTKSNSDGFKENGFSFPSGSAHEILIQSAYAEANVSLNDVCYIEAHGTGTSAGDPEELNAISKVFFGKSRQDPLLLGSVKSNMGHSEAAAGLCAVIKMVLSLHYRIIPPNLHFECPNPNIPGLLNGSLKVVSKQTELNGHIVGINSFGIGGSNVHIILKRIQVNDMITKIPNEQLPLLIPFSGRTFEAVKLGLEKVHSNFQNDTIESVARVFQGIHSAKIEGHQFRSYCLFQKNVPLVHAEIQMVPDKPRPLWVVFPGVGAQWPGMGSQLIYLKEFRNSIEKSLSCVKHLEIDLIHMLTSKSPEATESHEKLCYMTMGIALIDLIKSIGIEPEGMIGHSAGEMLCAYADGSVTREEALLAFHSKDQCLVETEVGEMISVGLSWEEATSQCISNTYPACHNAVDNVTVSGKKEDVRKLAIKLKSEGIFVKDVESNGVAYHSPYVVPLAKQWVFDLREILRNPKPRSKSWISTTFPEAEWQSPIAQVASSDYFIKNFTSPVLFYDAMKHIPSNAIVLEVSPHSLLRALLKRTLPETATILSIMKKYDDQNLYRFVSAIGDLFALGLNLKIPNLYGCPTTLVQCPPLSPLILWKHDEHHPLLDYLKKPRRSYQEKFLIDLDEQEWKFLSGHKIDGRVLFPATGYLVLVWKAFAKVLNQTFESTGVYFEKLEFKRIVLLEPNANTAIEVQILKSTGQFVVTERNEVIITGVIATIDELPELKELNTKLTLLNNEYLLQNDIYKEFRLRGNYEYLGEFRGIKRADLEGNTGILSWTNNWIPYLDSMIHLQLLSTSGMESRTRIPTRIRFVKIQPEIFKAALKYDEMVSNFSKFTKNISCSGIIINDVHLTQISSRTKVEAQTVLNEYRFIPYFDEECFYEFSLAINIMMKIIAENCFSSSIKVQDCSVTPCEELIQLIQDFPNENPYQVIFAMRNADKPHENGSQLDLSLFYADSGMEFNFNEIIVISKFRMIILEIQSELNERVSDNLDWNIVAKMRIGQNDRIIYLLKSETVEKSFRHEIIYISPTNFEWLEKLKLLINDKSIDRIYLTANVSKTGICGLGKSLRYEAGGEKIRCFQIEDKNEFQIYFDQIRKADLFINIIRKQNVGTFVYVNGIQRIYENKITSLCSAYLNISTPGDLTSLNWYELPKPLNSSNNICLAYYSAVNFRDIMICSGKLLSDAIPGNVSSSLSTLGLEFAGIDQNGQRVMGAVECLGIATQVKPFPEFSWEVPKAWSLEDAATVPIAYSTAYYALIVRGKLQQGETVLITSGSGAVGQSALQICSSLECNIYVTVGSEEKKNFLIKEFPNLVESQILNSRTIEFRRQILTRTHGKGVDVILNSLAEDKLQAALEVLGEGGRFLEIGKFDMSQNTPLGMELFLKNITFHGILLDALFNDKYIEIRRQVAQLVSDGIHKGVVKPLPRKVYDFTQAEEAFRYMSSGKHTGKVILKFRNELDGESTKLCVPNVFPVTYFESNSLFIVSGGLGGFGLELINWMILRGMRNVIILCSSRGISNNYQLLQMKKWGKKGVQVMLHKEKLTTECLASFVSKYEHYGHIRGIFNLAMVLSDAIFENQNEIKFKTTLQPKLFLTQVLNELSQKCCPELKYFVCFSSIVAGRGNLGQANYAMANAAMDEIILERRKLGFPGLSIQWGGIGDVGVLSEKLIASQEYQTNIAGTIPQSISSCLDSLDKILYFQNEFAAGIVCSYVQAPTINSTTISRNQEEKETQSIYRNIIKILGINENVSETKQNKSLGELGIDSLMLVEIRLLFERHGFHGMSSNEIRKLTLSSIRNNMENQHSKTSE